MGVRTILVIGLAAICGLSAVVAVNRLRGASPNVASDTVPVVVAAMNIPRGTTVSEDLVQLRQWPKDLVPPGAITSMEDAVARAALNALIKHEPLLDGKLAAKDAGVGMAALVPTGMRAYTIHTPTVASGVAGFILPGNKVDVLLTVTERLWTGTIGDATGGGSTTTLLQHVEILAVDQRLDAPPENMIDTAQLRSVTLLVSPDHAAKLSLAQTKGKLHLSLRNDEDTLPVNTQPVTLKSLRFQQEETTGQGQVLESLMNVLGRVFSLGGQDPVASTSETPEEETVAVPRAARLRIRTLRGTASGGVDLDPIGEVIVY